MSTVVIEKIVPKDSTEKKGFDNDPIEEKQEIKIRGGDQKIKHKNVIFRVD